jgi:ubiquinone biosynthesis protein UbiJ
VTSLPGLDPTAIPGAVANRVLEREAWARERLAAFAGRVFVIRVGPVATAFHVETSGLVATMPLAGRTPDLTLRLSAFALPSFLADPLRWDHLVTADGDPALAATLKELAQTLPWFVEQAFAKALGPIVGQRVADAGRHLLAFPEYAASRVGASVAGYARDEAGLLASGDDGRSFAADVAAVVARVDALAERLAALEARAPGSGDRR